MSLVKQLWISCLVVIGIIFAATYFTIKNNKCLVEAVKIHTQYQVPFNQVVELCK